jgi:tetratricopeptide (TPR) repeat protein
LEWRIAAAVVAIVGIIAALAIWRPWAGREQVPRVVVEAAANDRYSQALARDLVVKLGSLQSIHSAPMRLINRSDSSGDRPDLVLEVGRLADSSAVTANLALMTARDRGILWSKEFEQPSRNLADLKQQIAYTAARVLGCATDGLRAPGKPLREEPLKLYLNACGQLAEVTDEAPAVVPALLQVIRQAPRFKAAWKLLLLTEADMVDPVRQEGNADPALRRTLADHIAAARKLDPQMAEATIAQIALLHLTDFVKRMQLIDQAKRNSPDNPVVLQIRSQMLRTVGRMREAIEDSSRAVDLNPLSPLLHAGYFNALIYAGGLESAPQELRRVEQLWPGSSTLRDMQRRYHLRFGDPKIARELLTEDAYQGDELYLTARAQPTPENIDRFVAYALGLGRTQAARLVWLMQGLGQFHREDQLFQVMMTWPRPQDFAALEDAWFRPQLKAFREDARFMRVAARSPLIKYWQTTGNWPDFCSDPGFPYNCKAEAAKVTA